jgi:hypothetical protein
MLLSSIEELEARSPLDEKARQHNATKMIVVMHRGCPEYGYEARMLRSIIEAKEKKSPITVEPAYRALFLCKYVYKNIN